MFSKVNFYAKICFTAFLLITVMSCATYHQKESQNSSSANTGRLHSGFALPQQKAPPNDIQSIQLHPQGEPSGAPVIELDSQEQLVLSFDYLGDQSRQFGVEVSHRTQNWQESAITPSTFLDSFSRAYIQNGKSSFTQRPSYQHVEYKFPNNNLRPAVSGNYLLEVYDYRSGDLLFSLPFFITENKGNLDTDVETLFAQGKRGRPLDQLYSTYRYPDFVEFPQFDLSMSFTQNQFWGQMREAGFLNTITPGQIRARLEGDQAYIGSYEFKTLDLRSLQPNGKNILEYQPGQTPPLVILRRDVQNLDNAPRPFPPSNIGTPLDDRGSEYARVKFSLETNPSISQDSKIYIVGHFNNWMINDLNKMNYNPEKGLWTGHALAKQGVYAYKYMLVRDNWIDPLALDQNFLSAKQEYLTFVYFKDPDKNFDRLLKVNKVIRR